MIIHNVEQGSAEWHALRLAVPTASNFDKIITTTGKPSKQIESYADTLAIEKYTGRRDQPFVNAAMQHGIDTEQEAAESYAFITDYDVKEVGFITNDAGTLGASPDRLVNQGLLEIKCPKPENHLANLRAGMDNKYIPQIQGQLWICEKEWCDFMSYSYGLPPLIKRIYRDEVFINQLSLLCDELLDKINNTYEYLKTK